MPLKWYGKRVSDKMRRAQIAGVNATMGACVVHAKRNHAWQNRTGTLEGAIDIVDYAKPAGAGVRGVWGARDVRYALIHELGGVIKAKTAKALKFRGADGTFVQVQSVTMPKRPYLRPAADAEYPKLADRIRVHYERAA
jgi:hypothetical protein